MTTDLPTASITGQQGWDWNRRQAEQCASTDSSDDRIRGRTTADRCWGRSADRDDLLRTIRSLERQLERKDRRQQHIIDHYERLLAARERQHMERANEASLWEKLTAMLTATR